MKGIFPENSLYENSILELNTSSASRSATGYGRSPVFLFDSGEFKMVDGKVYIADGVEALKNWVEKVLRTERYRFPIYSPDYGVTLEELVADNLPNDIIENTLKLQITEALLQNPAIEAVGKFEFSKAKNCLNISFEVESVKNETVNMEVGVNV